MNTEGRMMKLEEVGREMLVYLQMESWEMETKKEVGKGMEGTGKAKVANEATETQTV